MKTASLSADLIETVDFRLVESFLSCHADLNGQLFCHAVEVCHENRDSINRS